MPKRGFQITVDETGKLLTFDKRELRRTMRAAGAEVMRAAKLLLRASAGTGRTYYSKSKGRHRASSPGQAPASQTKELIRSLKVRPFKSGMGVAVRASAFYALFLEGGAQGGVSHGGSPVEGRKRHARFGPETRARIGLRNSYNKRTGERTALVGRRILLPRPFLTVALARKGNSLSSRIADAVTRGIKFQREK